MVSQTGADELFLTTLVKAMAVREDDVELIIETDKARSVLTLNGEKDGESNPTSDP